MVVWFRYTPSQKQRDAEYTRADTESARASAAQSRLSREETELKIRYLRRLRASGGDIPYQPSTEASETYNQEEAPDNSRDAAPRNRRNQRGRSNEYNSNGYYTVPPENASHSSGRPHDIRNPQDMPFGPPNGAPSLNINGLDTSDPNYAEKAYRQQMQGPMYNPNYGRQPVDMPQPRTLGPKEDGGFIQSAIRFIYDDKTGVQWGNIVGGLAGALGGYFMGGAISSMAGGGMLGTIATVLMTVSGMAFGSRLVNELFPKAPVVPTPQGDPLARAHAPGAAAEVIMGKLPPEIAQDTSIEGTISPDGRSLNVTHMILENVNGQTLRIPLATPQTIDRANPDVATFEKLAIASQVLRDKTSGTRPDDQKITSEERKVLDNTIIKLDDDIIKGYNDAIMPPAATPAVKAPPPVPAAVVPTTQPALTSAPAAPTKTEAKLEIREFTVGNEKIKLEGTVSDDKRTFTAINMLVPDTSVQQLRDNLAGKYDLDLSKIKVDQLVRSKLDRPYALDISTPNSKENEVKLDGLVKIRNALPSSLMFDRALDLFTIPSDKDATPSPTTDPKTGLPNQPPAPQGKGNGRK